MAGQRRTNPTDVNRCLTAKLRFYMTVVGYSKRLWMRGVVLDASQRYFCVSKAPSTPATMSKQQATLSKQHSTLLPQTATISNDSIVKFRPFDNVECCETNWTCLICFDFVERTKFRSTLLPKPATLLPKNDNNVEATFDTVERIVQLVAFNNVASTLLLVWTRLKTVDYRWRLGLAITRLS